MIKWKRTPWLAALALGSVLVLAGGCSDDDDDDGDGGGGDFELRDGTYSVVISGSFTGPGECAETVEPITLQFPFCGVDDPGDVTGGEDGEECEVEGDGDDFEFHCTSADTVGGCIYTTHSEGEGSFGEESFTITVTSFETVSPTTPPCVADPCTTITTLTGTWLNSNCSGAPTYPLRSLIRNAGKLAAGR
jgi:hypothetical protein